MCDSFVHLHNHTEYSLLDGASRIPEMVSRAKELQMPAIAITDHGVMFGCMEFYFECVRQGVKPIIGMEAYVAPGGLANKMGREENHTYHLLLLAKNEQGYRNLCRLHSVAALEGFYYKPRIDHELLRAHAAGLVGSTTCIGSEVNQMLLTGDYDGALARARLYKEIFDEGSYFVELQNHGLEPQRIMNEGLLRIAKELDLPLVATNDSHFLCKTDAEPHDVLLCIGMGRTLSETDRIRFTGNEFIKSGQEMERLFPDQPEALENSAMIAGLVELKLDKQRNLMPEPEMPVGHVPASYLRALAETGLRDRLPGASDEAHARLEYELGVISQTGFDSYFLLVREFANFTRSSGIAFGVRGSAAGSLVSYALGITDVDPIAFDLTFERFLNPERVSMPDIDMDFEDARRDEVIRWVTERYGADRVAQIVTFGTLGAKAAIRDAARVMGYPPIEADRVCKTLPTIPGMTIRRAMGEVAEFREIVNSAPSVQRLVSTAESIEGVARHAGVHAAGVVISGEPLSELIPLYRSSDGLPVTAYEMGILEKIGLLKMDFLGLSNLTVLSRSIETIAERTGRPFALEEIPEDDPDTYAMLSRGETIGVFQLESGGMRRAILAVKPSNVRELAALIALYRPGPMEHIARYATNKQGSDAVEVPHPLMAPILEETYGVIVYQDQVLKLVQALAGFSLGKADVLRRAMGKKDKAIMASMQVEFMAGCAEHGVEEAVATRVWKLLLPFAGYAFNKAHAVCYAILAYQTAYLKSKFPLEFMTAMLAVFQNREERVTALIEDCRRMAIAILPPSVNQSRSDFSFEQPAGIDGPAGIRFGLAAIKGLGEGLVRKLIEERERRPFTHLFEFAERCRPHGLNRASLEALVRAGALDGVVSNRKVLLDNVEAAIVFAEIRHRDRLAGQDSLFGEAVADEEPLYPDLPATDPLERSELLAMEKEVLGVYVSDHPLRGYERALSSLTTHGCATVPELEDGTAVRLAGIVSASREIVTKSKGDKMAAIVLEDLTGQAPCILFAKTYQRFRGLAQKDQVVRLRGTVSHRERNGDRTIEVLVDDMAFLERPESSGLSDTVDGTVVVTLKEANRSQFEALKSAVQAHPGSHEVFIEFSEDGTLPAMALLDRISPTDAFLAAVEKAVPYAKIKVIRAAGRVGLSPTTVETPDLVAR